jgi:RNA-directed DNA polymerase
MRLRRWLRNKHRVRCTGYKYYPDSYLYETLRLVRLTRLGCDVAWVKA